MNVMIEVAKYILRQSTDDFKQKRVAIVAPTAVAAKIVNGRTIDSAFQTYSPNRFGVDYIDPGRKANFDYEWTNLGKRDFINKMGLSCVKLRFSFAKLCELGQLQPISYVMTLLLDYLMSWLLDYLMT